MYELIEKNKRRTTILIVLMLALMLTVGFIIMGPVGVVLAGIIWFIQLGIAYFLGSNALLFISNAKKAKRNEYPELFEMLEELKNVANLPVLPKLYIIDDPEPNAFATGRSPKHSAIAVTRGLLDKMNKEQIRGVLAHEVSHIVHRDILYMTIMSVSVGTIILILSFLQILIRIGMKTSEIFASIGIPFVSLISIVVFLFLAFVYVFVWILSIIAPFFANLIYLACSRQREYLADIGAAIFTRNPETLASALETIAKVCEQEEKKEVNALIAPLYIVNPTEVVKTKLASIFDTHPPIHKRIEILRSLNLNSYINYYDNVMREMNVNKIITSIENQTDLHQPSISSSEPNRKKQTFDSPLKDVPIHIHNETPEIQEKISTELNKRVTTTEHPEKELHTSRATSLQTSSPVPTINPPYTYERKKVESHPPCLEEKLTRHVKKEGQDKQKPLTSQGKSEQPNLVSSNHDKPVPMYTFLNCECGIILKIPSGFHGTATCKRCQRKYRIKKQDI